MIVSNYFIKKKIRGLIAQPPARIRGFRSLEEARSVLVFYQARDTETIRPCLESLRKMHKQLKVCVYAPVGVSLQLPDEHQFIANKDLDAWGFPSESKRRAIREWKADVLIDLSGPSCYPLQYLILQHPCPFKVGPKHPDLDLYDLSILVTDRDDIQYLFGQILFYLQSIHSK